MAMIAIAGAALFAMLSAVALKASEPLTVRVVARAVKPKR